MPAQGTLILTRSDVGALLSLDECIAAVEKAFRLHGEGKTPPPGILGIHAGAGGFHIKTGLLSSDRSYFVAKLNANFSQNPQRFGLPTIQGVVVLCDAENGRLLALLDSTEITLLRTGAATAIAAKYLARPDARVATVCGCGSQGRIQLQALRSVLPLERANVFDVDDRKAKALAAEFSAEPGITLRAVRDLGPALRESEVCVTCTPVKQPFLHKEDVRPGTFLAAVGADAPDKQELEPALLAGNKLVTDVTEQCATLGELHHALEAGLLNRADVYAELGEIVAGRKRGRTTPDEITIFDSTGMALQDAAAAIAVYEKALAAGRGMSVNLG